MQLLPLLVMFAALIVLVRREKKILDLHKKEREALKEKYLAKDEFLKGPLGDDYFKKFNESNEARMAYWTESDALDKKHDKGSNIFRAVLLPSLLISLIAGYSIHLLFSWGAHDWTIAAEGVYESVEYERGRGSITVVHFSDGRTYAMSGAESINYPKGTTLRISYNHTWPKEYRIEKNESPD